MHRNRLATETSPYLLQHAGNPVDWYPWGDEAFAKAHAEDKPVLLSIGYSACHWCHVMAHESFEDAEIAALMNSRFVNVKVDREERPDVDRVYQFALQLVARTSGGWPLTMFLAPQSRRPFFGGTYFPRDAGRGLPGFRDLLSRVADFYAANRAEILAQADALLGALSAALSGENAAASTLDAVRFDRAPLDAARAALTQAFDAEDGGFGAAPKFPHAAMIERALRHWRSTSAGAAPDLRGLYMAALSLTRMAEGGLYDAIGGGFHRYAVDRAWRIPHFEKMLYDNATLLALYAGAHVATGEALYGRVAAETAEWALREMRAPQGAFYASLDADGGGHEGEPYVWERSAVAAALDAEEYAVFAARFGLTAAPNFEDRWHLRATEAIAAIAARRGRSETEIEATIGSARRKLAAVRARRPQPARDEKILTAWNALMIKGLAIAARALDRADLAAAAAAAADCIEERSWRDGRLYAVHAGDRARFPAYLDDHAFLADALLELLQTRWRARDWHRLIALAEILLERFEDAQGGGFYFTADGEETPLLRLKSFADESLPSGNGVAADVLLRLGYLAAEPRYLRAARRTLAAALPSMTSHPAAHMGLMNALQCELETPRAVIIRGPPAQSAQWAHELQRAYAPGRLVLAIPAEETQLPRVFADKPAGADAPLAYLCVGTTCSAPFADFGALLAALDERRAAATPAA